jgi:NADPH:quinone reductase-like Zn-dependent oxidoreductase
MRAIVISEFGGPENLALRELPRPIPAAGEVLIRVRAFGVNRAETYMRRGLWAEAAPVSGIECAGTVEQDPSGRLARGTTVVAVMGGMGRTRNGSYAEYVTAPATNVVPVATALSWTDLAALPEVYATAWSALRGNLELAAGHTLLVRGATSALGQAAVDIAAGLGATVLATSRSEQRGELLRSLGAREALVDDGELATRIRAQRPAGLDRVLDLVGNRTLRDSLACVRPGGRVCQAGFLGGLAPVDAFNPIADLPTGVQLSFFGSFEYGTDGYPLADVPLAELVATAEGGGYRAKPARVFGFEEIAEAHRLMESGAAEGKLVVAVD